MSCYLVREGKKRGRGRYLTFRPKTGFCGQVLLGGGRMPYYVKAQKSAHRFKTKEAAEKGACEAWWVTSFRVVKLRGKADG